MPEYLAPGVYVEEVSYRSKSIEGVSTTTTGFIGPASYGPIDLEPEILVSLEDFERIYGGGQQLRFGDGLVMDNYLWHAARGFFTEGGRRLYVSRVFRPLTDAPYPPEDFGTPLGAPQTGNLYNDGHARAMVPVLSLPNEGEGIHLRARFPGAAGNMLVRFTLQLGQNVLGGIAGRPTVGALRHDDVVFIRDQSSPIDSPPGSGAFYRAETYFDTPSKQWNWRFIDAAGNRLELAQLTPNANPQLSDQVRVVTLSVTVTTVSSNPSSQTWAGLALDPNHLSAGVPDSFTALFAPNPPNVSLARSLPIVITLGDDLETGLDVLDALLSADTDLRTQLLADGSTDVERSVDVLLAGGNDGRRPLAAQYEGQVDPVTNLKSGLKAFEDLEDISIVAAPGSSFGYETDPAYQLQAMAIIGSLIAHANLMLYRIVIIDSGNAQALSAVRAMRAKINSKYAAFYYPWVRVVDPITGQPIHLPPSGFVAGIYARNDINRAVYKAPANEVVNLAVGFEMLLNKAQQDVLNPEGINCFRFFEGRGYMLWGARLATDDPEWKYVNLRRYFAYLERSIDLGTQWAVFEVNSERLWANVRYTIQDFLYNEWVAGAFLGDKPEKAYFVRCDRSTMTQNDLDNGRLVCLIGVAAVRPAEFVIFRIGQWTGDRK